MKILVTILFLTTLTLFLVLAYQRYHFKKKLSEVNQSWFNFENERAQEIEKFHHLTEVGKLASGIFHDLANPLTALILNLEQIQFRNLKEIAETEWAQKIAEANLLCQRMTHLLRTVSKQLVTNAEVKDWFSVNEEVEGVLNLLSYKARSCKVDLRNHLESEIFLNNDALKFNRIICNLINNAIEAIDANKKSSWIEIKMRLINDHLLITITDNGQGFPDHLKDKLFEPFFSTKKGGGNLGLGLAIVSDLVTKYFQGELRVVSQAQKFTAFTIDIPVKAEDIKMGEI